MNREQYVRRLAWLQEKHPDKVPLTHQEVVKRMKKGELYVGHHQRLAELEQARQERWAAQAERSSRRSKIVRGVS